MTDFMHQSKASSCKANTAFSPPVHRRGQQSGRGWAGCGCHRSTGRGAGTGRRPAQVTANAAQWTHLGSRQGNSIFQNIVGTGLRASNVMTRSLPCRVDAPWLPEGRGKDLEPPRQPDRSKPPGRAVTALINCPV